MAMTINTNLSALTAQRNLNASAMKSSSSLAKLSSGSRISQAKDDAASLAVGSKLTAEVAGLRQASLNAGQAASMLQIADGAMSQIGDVLTRMKSLAVQSVSGQLSDTDRATLNTEFTSLRSEIDRIANDTEFNGVQLLNGGDTQMSLTDGNIGDLTTKGVSLSFDTGVTGPDSAFEIKYDDAGNMTVKNKGTGTSQTIDISTAFQNITGAGDLTTDLSVGETLSVNFASLGVTVTLDNNFNADGAGIDGDITVNTAGTAQAAVETASINTLSGGDISGAQLAAMTTLDASGTLTLNVGDDADDTLDFDATAGLEFSTDGITYGATASATADGSTASLVYVRAVGATEAFASIDLSGVDVVGASGGAANTLQLDMNNLMVRAEEGSAATATFNFQVGTGTTTANDQISVSISGVNASTLGVNGSTVDSATNASNAVDALDSAISTLASARASVGASQSRLDFASNNLNVAIENSEAARSALMDVDVSSEMTNFTSAQVLVQAGVSMLSQANQQPSLLLKLLG